MDFQAWIFAGAGNGGVPYIIYAYCCSSCQNDLIIKCPFWEVSLKDISHGIMGERLFRTQVVNKHPAIFVCGDKSFPHPDSFNAVINYLDHQLRLVQIMPDRLNRKGAVNILATFDNKRHPSNNTILLVGHHIKIAR